MQLYIFVNFDIYLFDFPTFFSGDIVKNQLELHVVLYLVIYYESDVCSTS